jgi:hypothetical protein
MAAPLALMLARMAVSVAPPPAAATAWVASFGGMAAQVGVRGQFAEQHRIGLDHRVLD